MRLLILGGTRFLGRALVEAALECSHEVTLFNRGQSNPDLFPDLEKLRGDRDGDLAALKGRRWDAIVDTCGYLPRVVCQSAELLAGAVDCYAFISTLSVYAGFSQPGIDESTPLGTLEDETVEEVTGETYGPLKGLCEKAVQTALPGRALIVRPGLIVGPHDPTDRFTYWPHRVAQGGQVLAPGRPARAVQFVDVRDLAGWVIRLVETKQRGVYNATGPEEPLPMEQLLNTCKAVSGSDATFTWVSEEFLLETGVQPWSEVPLWLPESDPAFAGFNAFDCRQAIAAGLTFRPLADTVRDTLAWEATRPDDHAWRAGLTCERESELLLALLPFSGYNGNIYGEEPKMSEPSALQWEIDQLVKARLFPDEQAVLRSALRALFESQPKLRRQMVVRAYIAGEISLGKAAEVLGVSHEEMKDILREEGAQIHLGPRTTDELLRDATNA